MRLEQDGGLEAVKSKILTFDYSGALDLLGEFVSKPSLGDVDDLICIAARQQGSKDVISRLLTLGWSANHRCQGSDHVLACCVLADSPHGLRTLPEFEMLLFFGADPKEIALGGGTLPMLHFVIDRGKLDFAEVLLKAGADPHQETELGWTAFDVAKRRRNKPALDLLQRFV